MVILFQITIALPSNEQFEFQNDLINIVKKYPNAHYDRNKGLGEMDVDAFAEAAFGPDARLIQFTMNGITYLTHSSNVILCTKQP